MKRIFILVLGVLILSGCSVVYDLDIKDGYTETIRVIPDDDSERNLINNYSQNDTAFNNVSVDPEDEGREEGLDYYSYKIEKDNIIASFKFKDKYAQSHAANHCFPSFLYLKDSNTIRINTTSNFECFNYYPSLKSVMINIKVPYDVISHNADSVNGDTYTWIYLYDGTIKSIDLQFKNPDAKEEDKNLDTYEAYMKEKSAKIEEQYQKEHPKKDYSKYLPLFLGLCGLFFVGLFAIMIYGNKKQK